jgi:hypothetical protein
MFTNLLIVVAAGLLAPLALGFFPRVRLPAIVLGIVVGPSGLGGKPRRLRMRAAQRPRKKNSMANLAYSGKYEHLRRAL